MAMHQALPEYFRDIKALIREKRYAEAQPRLENLTAMFPRNAEILATTGTVQLLLGNHGNAIVFLERALDLGCTAQDCFSNLANAYKAEGDLDTAHLYYELALERGRTPNLCANMAGLYINEGGAEHGIALCDEALALDPSHSLARFNRSIAYLEMGRWEEGFQDYHRHSHAHTARARRDYSLVNRSCPEWDGTPGKVVATWGEQGLGDELMFSSCIPDLCAVSSEAIIECDIRLEPLFRRSFPQAHIYGTTHHDSINWNWHHSIDASIAMGGLPQFFRKEAKDFPRTPFLKADAWQTRRWRERLALLGSLPKVGISWIGGLKGTRIEQRSIPLENWGPILDLPYRFINLQWQESAEEEAQRYGITTFHEALTCFDFGASLMQACDLVISVTNTNVHLAGGLGKSCICLTPVNPAWPFCKDPNIWYGSVTHARQVTRGEWRPVIQDVANQLRSVHREAAE